MIIAGLHRPPYSGWAPERFPPCLPVWATLSLHTCYHYPGRLVVSAMVVLCLFVDVFASLCGHFSFFVTLCFWSFWLFSASCFVCLCGHLALVVILCLFVIILQFVSLQSCYKWLSNKKCHFKQRFNLSGPWLHGPLCPCPFGPFCNGLNESIKP